MRGASRVLVFVALGALPSLAIGCATESTLAEDSGQDASALDAAAVDAGSCTSAAMCDDGLYCNGTETCTGGRCQAGTAPSCDDGIACTVDRCSEGRRACDNAVPDHDADGFTDFACRDSGGVPLGTDCDDADAMRYPGNPEVCDAAGHDEDCNPATYGAVDMDGDSFDDAACCNTGGLCGTDCDDTNPAISPSDTEVCNGADDDCDMRLDEGLPNVAYRPDCDVDGYGDAMATAMMACTTPTAAPCVSAGQWVMQAGDCADDDPNRHVGATEACNGIDDDCDARVDDIIDGTVICRAGETTACSTTCGLSGVSTCAATCLSFGPACVAAEVCNGCDDDADGSVDDGFMCARGTSETCTVSACGTSGTRVCSSTCGWGACVASEACNYCDDDGDGNYFEERPLATVVSSDHLGDCGALSGGHTACGPDPIPGGQDLWATLIDGTSNDQAGALWLDPPSTWTQGWGSTQVTVDLEVTGVTAGGAAEQPLGGWAVIIGHGGTTGVGTPQNRGIPLTISGVAASWFWSSYDFCTAPSMPPYSGDSFRFQRLVGGGIASPPRIGLVGGVCSSGELLEGSAANFDGVGGPITERLVLRYTPDDPTTAATNEELVSVTASTPGVGGALTYDYAPSNDLPLGTAPLRIGITAGTFTQSGFSGPPASRVYGVPVRARVHVWRQIYPTGGGPNMMTYTVPVTRTSICP